MRRRLLDLFCGIGGCSVGYARAGFDVTGVDLEPMPDYPFTFVRADALELVTDAGFMAGFDAVAASPPCPRYSSVTRTSGDPAAHPDLVGPILTALETWGGPYVVENVPGAPVPNPLILCGTEFNLGAVCRDGVYRRLRRHRYFGSNVMLMRSNGCDHRGPVISVHGGGGGSIRGRYQATKAEAAAAMGIDWATTKRGLTNAIPPAYTQYLGEQLLDQLETRVTAV